MNRRELLGRTALLGLGATLGSKVALDPRIARGAADPAAALAQLASTILVKDVNGVAAAPISVVKLGDDELAKIKGMNATAAIVMHYGGNDWSRAQIQALQTQFASMGIKVIAVTDAGFKAEKQVSDIETVLTQKPSIIIGVPVDPAATARAFKAAADQGVKVVFANFAPSGLVAGKDYVSVVSADEYGNGVAAALLLVQALGGKGEVGLVYHAADFHVTRQRYEAVKATLKDYPDVKVVAEQGIGGPDFPGDAEKAASAMLTSHRRDQGHLGGLGRAGRGRDLGRPHGRPRRLGDHHDRPGRECRDRHGERWLRQGPGRPARLRPGRHRGAAGRLRPAGQGGAALRRLAGPADDQAEPARGLADRIPRPADREDHEEHDLASRPAHHERRGEAR